MFWTDILTQSVFALLLIVFGSFGICTFAIIINSLCRDLIERDKRFKRSMELRKPVFEQDEEDSKIIYFYPHRK